MGLQQGTCYKNPSGFTGTSRHIDFVRLLSDGILPHHFRNIHNRVIDVAVFFVFIVLNAIMMTMSILVVVGSD